MTSCSFPKEERLCSKKLIEALFGGGHKSMSAYPVRAVFMPIGQESTDIRPIQVLISVSKRHFKHAVDRNRVKRQLREAYRLNRHLLLRHLPSGTQLVVAFIWLSPEHFDSAAIHAKMQKLLLRIGESLRET